MIGYLSTITPEADDTLLKAFRQADNESLIIHLLEANGVPLDGADSTCAAFSGSPAVATARLETLWFGGSVESTCH